MGFFSKTLQAAMPKMIGNPITTAVAMVSVALSVVKGKKATKATKNKKKATVKKSKIVSKKQKKQMEVMERVCQSAYGVYIRGVTTVAARYIGHPAVAIPASEMVKTMMEEAAPKVNYLVQLERGSKKESNIKEEKNRIDKHTSGRFEYLKGCTNGWYTGFTKAIKGEQVIDQKYTLENLFSGNLTVEDMPDLPEYMTMVGAVIGAKYKGLWNSAKGTYDGVVTLVTDPEKVLEVASDAILDFMEDPWENTKELAGNIRDSVVDAVWRSTPQEISEDAGEILGDVLTAVSTGGGGKAAASGAKIAGKKLLALGKTGVREFVEGLEDLGKIGAKNAVYVGATTGIENAAKNSFINRLMMMASEAGDEAKKLTGVVEGATSKADDIATIAGKTGSVTNTVTSTTGELIENAVIGTPIVEGTKNITKEIVEGTTEKTTLRTTEKTTLQMLEEATDNIATGSKVDDIVEAEMKASSKVDDVAEVGAKASSKVDDVAGTGAKAGSKADDVAEAGAKAGSKADDTAKAADQTTVITVVEGISGVNGSGVKIRGELSEPKISKIQDIETRSKVIGNTIKDEMDITQDASTSIGATINNNTANIQIKTNISADMEKKILEGQRKTKPKNEVIGGHSPNFVNNENPDFAVEILTKNPDGTTNVKYVKSFPDGNISKIKNNNTLFPDTWSDREIINAIKIVGDTPPIATRSRDGATLHRTTVNGVQIEVIKIGSDVISGYPTGGGVTGILIGFNP